MQKAVKIGLIGVIVFCMLQPVVVNPVVSFLFLGIIPGTNLTLPFWAMGLFYISISMVMIAYLTRQDIYIGDMHQQEKIAKKIARQKVRSNYATAPSSPSSSRKTAYRTATNTSKS